MLSRRILLATPLLGTARPARAAPGCEGVACTLEGTGAPAGRVVVFGQAFMPGVVPQGSRLAAFVAAGPALPVQIDVLNRHADGSARLAILALAAPALAAGAKLPVLLVPDAGAPPPRFVPSLAGRQAVVEVGGWRCDLLAGFAAAPPWQAGALAVQARVAQAVPAAAAGGVASLRLVADVALRADGTLWVEAWLRNDVAMRPNGGPASYAARLVLDGQIAWQAEIRGQAHYTGWGRLAGGAAAPLIRHDAGALADAGAGARYNRGIAVAEPVLARFAQAMAAPDWQRLLGPRQIAQDMRQTGGRPDIGPATMAQAAWLISGDRRAAAYAIGQAEAAGGIPWHHWEDGWLTPDRYPRLWTDGRGGPAPGGLMQPVAADTGWMLDCAHQPELSFVPFLLTGRRAFLDNLQAQAAWCVLSQWPAAASRGVPGGPSPGDGVNVVRGNQVRGAAWSLRQLEHAAWATPEADPLLPWLKRAAAGNWAWLRAQIPAWSAEQGEARGWIPGEYGTAGVLPPWQQDYFASTAALAARRGSADAALVLGWMENFLLGRFAGRGLPRHDGAAYLLAIRDARGRPLQSWAAIGAATVAQGLSNGTGWSKTEGDYAQLALMALASLPRTPPAYFWLAGAGAPFTRPQDFARDPVFSIVPSGISPGCAG
jgi:hypothetical protein